MILENPGKSLDFKNNSILETSRNPYILGSRGITIKLVVEYF